MAAFTNDLAFATSFKNFLKTLLIKMKCLNGKVLTSSIFNRAIKPFADF